MRRLSIALLLLFAASRAGARELQVHAAASLSDALEAIGSAYSRSTGTAVRFNFGASMAVARQIAAGAPGDVFISADDATMDRLQAAGNVIPSTRIALLGNTLAIVVRRDSSAAVASANDLLRLGRVAVGQPESVPAGSYAKQYLERAGLWRALSPHLVPCENVRATLAAVVSGNADAGIVYRTDAIASPELKIAAELTGPEAPQIRYPAAVLRETRDAAEAARFVEWLRGREARSVFESDGFTVLARAVTPSGVSAAAASHSRRPLPQRMIAFTVGAALLATLLLLVPGTLLAWALARAEWRGKSLVETLVALPLVMPPVATGLILLQLLGRRGVIGSLLHRAGIDVVFTWRAVVIAMSIMAFPLFVRNARIAFEQVSRRFEEIARTLGASERRVFFTITLPLASRGIIGGAVLAFARALGEFGATVLVAGNIPGRTSTIAVSIYNFVQLGRDADAMRLMAISVAIAFGAVWASEMLLRRRRA